MEDLDDFPNNFYPFYTQFIGQVSPSVFMSIHILTKHGKKMWKCFSPAVVDVPEPSKFKRSISYHHFSAHLTLTSQVAAIQVPSNQLELHP